MSRVFLDVGAHHGETLQEAEQPRWRFDRLFAYEPLPDANARLRQRWGQHDRISVRGYGLADTTGQRNVYGSNDKMEASIYADKTDVDAAVVTVCPMREATEEVREVVEDGDTAIMKLNCEGAEVPILRNLIGSGAIWLLAHVLIDFDIRRVAGREADADALLFDLARIGYTSFSVAAEVMVGGTHQERTAAWLRRTT